MTLSEAVIINGISLHYSLVGEGPMLIVQCPGWGTGAAYLQQTLAPLERDFRILYYDTRGSGLSERPQNSIDICIGHMVRDLEALRVHWNIPHFALLGHSHGALISLNYALKYPHHISCLVLIAPQLGQSEVLDDVRRNVPKLESEPKYQSAAREWLTAKPPKTDEEFGNWLKSVFDLYFYNPETGRSLWSRLQLDTIARGACRAVSVSNPRYTVREHLKKILLPTLIIIGEHDFITSPAQARIIHREIVNSEMLVCRNSGHFPWLEEPDDVFSTIGNFIRRYAVEQ